MKKILVGLLLTLLVPTQALADGIIIPPPNQNITSAQQKAVIVYQNEKEDLILSVEFSGDAQEFAWIIPVPSKPEVARGKDELFTKIGQLTKPKENLLDKIRGRQEIVYPMGLGAKQEAVSSGRGVEVIETKRVGILDTVVLKATKATELQKWLTDNGFEFQKSISPFSSYLPGSVSTESVAKTQTQELVPPTQEKDIAFIRGEGIDPLLQVFQDYIDDDWYFVAAKVGQEFISGKENKSISSRPTEIAQVYPYGTGHITPLQLTFVTKKIIYPMKISSLSSSSPSVLLYVISEHRQKVSNYFYEYPSSPKEESNLIFQTEYAAPIKASELSEWLPDMTDGYLTKLYAPYLYPEQMAEDLRFENFQNDKEVNTGQMSSIDWLKVIPLLSVYGPFKIVTFFTSGRFFVGSALTPILLACLGGGLGLFWSGLFYFLLTRTRKRIFRFILYLTQFPGMWLLANALSVIILIPSFIMMTVLNVEEDVVPFTLILRNNFAACLFTALLYIIQAKIHLLFRGNAVGEKV